VDRIAVGIGVVVYFILAVLVFAGPFVLAQDVSPSAAGYRVSDSRVLGIVHRSAPHDSAVWLVVGAKGLSGQVPDACFANRQLTLVAPPNRFDVLRSARLALAEKAEVDVEFSESCQISDFRFFSGKRSGSWETH